MKEDSDLNDDVALSIYFDCSAHLVFLKITKTKVDGNCIFSAMVHKLFKTKLANK